MTKSKIDVGVVATLTLCGVWVKQHTSSQSRALTSERLLVLRITESAFIADYRHATLLINALNISDLARIDTKTL